MDTKIAAQIAGTADFRTVGQSGHAITAAEHNLAVEVGYEIAKKYGIDLAAHVAAQFESEKTWGGPGRGQGAKAADGATGLKRVNITIDPGSAETMRAIGDGDLSLGIRRAARKISDKS